MPMVKSKHLLGCSKHLKFNNQAGLSNKHYHVCITFFISVREQLKDLTKQYDKSENDLKALQSVGQVG